MLKTEITEKRGGAPNGAGGRVIGEDRREKRNGGRVGAERERGRRSCVEGRGTAHQE